MTNTGSSDKDTPLTREERMQMLRDSGLDELEAEWRRLGILERESKRILPDILADLERMIKIESLHYGASVFPDCLMEGGRPDRHAQGVIGKPFMANYFSLGEANVYLLQSRIAVG